MSFDLTASVIACSRCGTTFSTRKGFFSPSYAPMYKGNGFLHICKNCVDELFLTYYEQCGDEMHAMRQLCRKLDLYWNEELCANVASKTSKQSLALKYIARLTNNATTIGKCYDDTLSEEGRMWQFALIENRQQEAAKKEATKVEEEDDSPITLDEDNIEITDDIVRFWGSGYPPSMYRSLEQRRRYWSSRLPEGIDDDVGTEALIRQICSLELDINRDRIEGKSIDKSVNTLNTLLGSLNLKPNQKKDDSDQDLDKTPMGVWLFRYEQKRPLPEIDEDMKDVNGILKYVFTWMGHLCKMMGKKNAYSKLYEDEINRLRVEMPEFNDEDDEEFLNSVFEASGQEK